MFIFVASVFLAVFKVSGEDLMLGSAIVHTTENTVVIDNVDYGLVVLATGTNNDPLLSCPLYQNLQQHIPTEFVGKFPVLDASLR